MSNGILSKRPHLIPSLIASIMSLLVLPDWPHDYSLPDHRGFILFCFALYVSRTAYQWGKILAAWLFGFIASFWLNIWLMDTAGERWQLVVIICAVLFAVVGFAIKIPVEETNTPRHLREGFWALAITGLLAMMFFVGSIDLIVKAKANKNGGYVPIYAGHGENREWVDDEWVVAEEYTRHLWGKSRVYLFMSVCFGGGFIYLIVKEKAKKNKRVFHKDEPYGE